MSQLQPDLALSPRNLVMHVVCVTARVCTQKADGLTKVLAGASMKAFVSDLGLASLTR